MIPGVGKADEPVNYFGVEGSDWLIENIYGVFSGPISFNSQIVKEKGFKEGRECLKIFTKSDMYGEEHLRGYVATEGQKVYLMTKYDETQWYLIYDFGLQPGESTEIVGTMRLWDPNPEILKYTVTCQSIEKLKGSDLNIMNVTIKQSDDETDPNTESYEMEDVWIQGIAGGDPFLNDRLFWLGGGEALIQFKSPEKILYESKPWVPHPTNIDNYFGKTGTIWNEQTEGGTFFEQEFVSRNYKFTIKDPEIINYRWANGIYKVNNNNYEFTGYYVSVNGAEVFLAAPDMKWRRIYNFALSESTPSIICGGINLSDPEWEPIEYYAKLVRMYKDKENPDIELMEVMIQPTPESLDQTSGYDQIWIKNIGSFNGMLENDFGLAIGGPGSGIVLESLDYNSEIIYSYGKSSVEGIMMDSGLAIENSIVGELVVSGSNDNVRVFDSMGREYRGTNGRFTGLTRGVYLIVAEGRAVKRFVR